MFTSIAQDKRIEQQARYVSAVVSAARRSDARKLRAIQMERSYLAEMEARLAARESVQIPTAMAAHAPAAVDTETWVPEDLASLLAWIRRIAMELSSHDPCAPVVPSGVTDAELALELSSPMRRCQLTYSESGGSPQAQRLVPVLQRLLTEFERRRHAMDEHLQQLPSLLHKLAAYGGPALRHAAQLPPSLALALLALPEAAPAGSSGGGGAAAAASGAARAAVVHRHAAREDLGGGGDGTTKDELAHGGALGGKAFREHARRLLKVLQQWHCPPQKLGSLLEHPPRLRKQEMARTPTRLRAAIVAATAAAGALCQAVRWAEVALAQADHAAAAAGEAIGEAAGPPPEGDGAPMPLQPPPSNRLPAQGARGVAVARVVTGVGGPVSLDSTGEPIIPSLGLASAGIGVQRDSHLQSKDREAIQDRIKRENDEHRAARAKARQATAALREMPDGKLGAVHAAWLQELSSSGLWDEGGEGGGPELVAVATPGVDDPNGLEDCEALVALIARRLHPASLQSLSLHGHRAAKRAMRDRAEALAAQTLAGERRDLAAKSAAAAPGASSSEAHFVAAAEAAAAEMAAADVPPGEAASPGGAPGGVPGGVPGAASDAAHDAFYDASYDADAHLAATRVQAV